MGKGPYHGWDDTVEENYEKIEEDAETRALNQERLIAAMDARAGQTGSTAEAKEVYEKAKQVLLELQRENQQKLNDLISEKENLDRQMNDAADENTKQAKVEQAEANNLNNINVDDLDTSKLDKTVEEINTQAVEHSKTADDIRKNLAAKERIISEKIRRARLDNLK